LKAHAGSLGLTADKLSDLHSDLATLKAQLAKAIPSQSIGGEAARSVRSVLEGATALAPVIMALAKATGAY
jgi:hypothetical protein